MSEMSDHHAAMHDNIELALLTDPTPAGWVYVDLEGINPRIIAHAEVKGTFVAYAERLRAILRALYGEFRADPEMRMRGMKLQINTAAFADEQRASARLVLAGRLAECGYSDDEIEQLIGPSAVAEAISEYAARVIGDDLGPAARVRRPRKRQSPPRSAISESDGDE